MSRRAIRGPQLDREYPKGQTLAVEDCPECGVMHAYPRELDRQALADPDKWICCPNGHWWHYDRKDGT